MADFWDKTFDGLGFDSPLYSKKGEIRNSFTENFFKKHRNKSNILSGDTVYEKHDKTSIFSTTIWNNKTFMWKDYHGTKPRETKNVIFGLESGICFLKHAIVLINGKGENDYTWIDLENFRKISHKNDTVTYNGEIKQSTISDISVLNEFLTDLKVIIEIFNKELRAELDLKKEKLVSRQSNVIQELDKDGDGNVDLIDNDFNKLLTKNQKKVVDLDRNYIHQFVKVSNYIKVKKQNIQNIFESLKNIDKDAELDMKLNLLRNQIHTYELLIFHSINMISSIVEEDMITFYEIYESFDKLGIFNSNWENEVAGKLNSIDNKLTDLLYAIDDMGNKIVNEISNLTYVTQESFTSLNNSVCKQLSEIDSTIKYNNLMTTIQTYQLYKINKNTRPLNKN